MVDPGMYADLPVEDLLGRRRDAVVRIRATDRHFSYVQTTWLSMAPTHCSQ